MPFYIDLYKLRAQIRANVTRVPPTASVQRVNGHSSSQNAHEQPDSESESGMLLKDQGVLSISNVDPGDRDRKIGTNTSSTLPSALQKHAYSSDSATTRTSSTGAPGETLAGETPVCGKNARKQAKSSQDGTSQRNAGMRFYQTYDDFVRAGDTNSASFSLQDVYASGGTSRAHHVTGTSFPRTDHAHKGRTNVQNDHIYLENELSEEEIRDVATSVQKEHAYTGNELQSPAMEELRNAIRCIATETSSKENYIPPTSLFGAGTCANIAAPRANIAHSEHEAWRGKSLLESNVSNRHANMPKKISVEEIRRYPAFVYVCMHVFMYVCVYYMHITVEAIRW
jgi:hypothetical protein